MSWKEGGVHKITVDVPYEVWTRIEQEAEEAGLAPTALVRMFILHHRIGRCEGRIARRQPSLFPLEEPSDDTDQD